MAEDTAAGMTLSGVRPARAARIVAAPAAATTIKIKSFAGARPAGGVLILLVSGTFSRRDGTPLPRREETPPRPFVLLSAFHY